MSHYAPAVGPNSFRDLIDPALAQAYRDAGWWGDVTLSSVVRSHAVQRADAPAYLTENGTLSWRGYDTAASRIAAALVSADLPAGERVAGWLPDSGTVHAAFMAPSAPD